MMGIMFHYGSVIAPAKPASVKLTQAVGEASELFPGAECLDSDLLEVRLVELGKGLEVDLVAQEEVGVLRQSL